VADTAVEDVDEHVVGARFAPFEGKRFELRSRTFGGISAGLRHGVTSS
jgi:hypothetical protein